jgi:predicted Holliday junction resolvase-like endonuclease
VFIQREVTEFIQRQITTNTAPFTSAFVYDDFKCERDVGFTVDAVIYDLCHGGNIKSRGVANSLIGGLSETEVEAYALWLH